MLWLPTDWGTVPSVEKEIVVDVSAMFKTSGTKTCRYSMDVGSMQYVSYQTPEQITNPSRSAPSSIAPVHQGTQHVPAFRLGSAQISDISARSNYSTDSAPC